MLPPCRLQNSERGGIISRFLFLVFFLALVLVLYLVRHPIMRFAGGLLVVDDAPRASDAIVVLGDDNYTGDRATRAAELLKAGWAPRVVASGRYLRPYATIAELEQHDLVADGVPATAVVRFPHRATDTREECEVLGPFLSGHGWKHILIVTSNYHTRRTGYICSRTLPAGTDLHVISAPDAEYNPDNWWHTRQGVKIFMHEVVGLVVATWELRHDSVRTTG
ncbi:MAG TPA: YdcF family protein [Candidatus Acidoferrum sp.]|nr:YdcF family protein [Candidatus Acidoferrum sp.]